MQIIVKVPDVQSLPLHYAQNCNKSAAIFPAFGQHPEPQTNHKHPTRIGLARSSRPFERDAVKYVLFEFVEFIDVCDQNYIIAHAQTIDCVLLSTHVAEMLTFRIQTLELSGVLL